MSHQFKSSTLRLGIFSVLILLMSAACSKSEPIVYQAPKEAPIASAPIGGEMKNGDQGGSMAAPVASAPEAASAGAPIKWTAPASWQSTPPSQMRLASFQVPGSGDGSIVILGGEAGGLAANVNRWRGQIGLEGIAESAIASQMKPVSTGLGAAKWIRITDAKKPDSGILATIISFSDSSIFVKLVAPVKTLDAQQANFLSLVKSIRAKDSK